MNYSQVNALYSQQSGFTFQLWLLHLVSSLIILEYNYLLFQNEVSTQGAIIA